MESGEGKGQFWDEYDDEVVERVGGEWKGKGNVVDAKWKILQLVINLCRGRVKDVKLLETSLVFYLQIRCLLFIDKDTKA